VVGSANGDLRNLCAKVGTMQAKHGPFDILFCTGNFFAQETPIEVIDELLENKLDCRSFPCLEMRIEAKAKASTQQVLF
jgi:hypothetical protein